MNVPSFPQLHGVVFIEVCWQMYCTFTFHIHHSLSFYTVFDSCKTFSVEFWCCVTKNNLKKSLSSLCAFFVLSRSLLWDMGKVH
jgi:hypothetical protein